MYFQIRYLKAFAFGYFLFGFVSQNADARILQVSWRESTLNAVFDGNGKAIPLFEDYVLLNCPVAGEAGVLAATENKLSLVSVLFGFDFGQTSLLFGTGFLQLNTISQIEAPGVDPQLLEADLNAIGCRSRNSRLVKGFTDGTLAIRRESSFGLFGFESSLAVNVPLDQNPQISGERNRRLSLDLAFAPSYGKKISISLPFEFRFNFPSNSIDRTLGIRSQLIVGDILLSAGFSQVQQFGAEQIYKNTGSDSLSYVLDASFLVPFGNAAFGLSYQRSLSGFNAIALDALEVSLVLVKL